MHDSPRIRGAALGFIFLTLAYTAALFWVDRGRGMLAGFGAVLGILPVLMLCSLATYLARYARWHWLLRRAGVAAPAASGFFAYIAGFAFTISPGKVGELVRIRYFRPMGASSEQVLAAFVFERLFDLLVVLALAAMIATGHDLLPAAALFVAIVFCLVILIASQSHRLVQLAALLSRHGLHRGARFLSVMGHGFAHIRIWLTPLDILIAVLTGLFAWGVTAWSFLLLLQHLGVSVPSLQALSLYPLAMLAGVASMLPGGIGSTEIAIVLLLQRLGVDTMQATLAAVGIRLATLWFATLLGLATLIGLELKRGAKR